MTGNINDRKRESFIETSEGEIALRVALEHGDNWRESVNEIIDLPVLENNIGDIRQVLDTGVPYRWNGTSWNIWISGSGGGGHTIQNNEISFTERNKLNFKDHIQVTDNPTNESTDVSIIGNSIQGYTITNWLEDKGYDANNLTLNELGDVLATLINDLKNGYVIVGGGSSLPLPYSYRLGDNGELELLEGDVVIARQNEASGSIFKTSVTTGLGSFHLSDAISIGSSGASLTVRDEVSDTCYVPLSLGLSSDGVTYRDPYLIRPKELKQVEINGEIGNQEIAFDYLFKMPLDYSVFSDTFVPAVSYRGDVKFKLFDQKTGKMIMDLVEKDQNLIEGGEYTFNFNYPILVKKDQLLRVLFTTKDDKPLYVKSNTPISYPYLLTPYERLSLREYVRENVASEDWVKKQGLDTNKIVMTGDKPSIVSKYEYVNPETGVTEFTHEFPIIQQDANQTTIGSRENRINIVTEGERIYHSYDIHRETVTLSKPSEVLTAREYTSKPFDTTYDSVGLRSLQFKVTGTTKFSYKLQELGGDKDPTNPENWSDWGDWIENTLVTYPGKGDDIFGIATYETDAMLNTYKRTYRMLLKIADGSPAVFYGDGFPATEIQLVQYNEEGLVEDSKVDNTCIKKIDSRAIEFDYAGGIKKYSRDLDSTGLNPMPIPLYDPWGKIIDKIYDNAFNSGNRDRRIAIPYSVTNIGIGNFIDSDNPDIKATIICRRGSAAHNYAMKNDLPFHLTIDVPVPSKPRQKLVTNDNMEIVWVDDSVYSSVQTAHIGYQYWNGGVNYIDVTINPVIVAKSTCYATDTQTGTPQYPPRCELIDSTTLRVFANMRLQDPGISDRRAISNLDWNVLQYI